MPVKNEYTQKHILSDGRTLILETPRTDIVHIRITSRPHQAATLERYGILLRKENGEKGHFSKENGRIIAKTSRIKLSVSTDLACFSLCDADGMLLTESHQPLSCGNEGGFDIRMRLAKNEKLYGLGDVTRDAVQKRGTKSAMWVTNVSSYIPLPTLLSTQGWGMVLNTTWRHFFDLGASDPDTMRFWSRNGEFDAYFFCGKDLPCLLETATAITGRPVLLPLWAYGLTFVCNQQANARDLVEDALNFRREGIPCDCIGLEPGWMEKNYDFTTGKTWHPDRFYIPPWVRRPDDPSTGKNQTFVGAINRLGFKLCLWLCQDYDLSYEEERRAGENIMETKQPVRQTCPDDFEQDPHFNMPVLQDTVTKKEEPWFEHLKAFVDDGVQAFKLDGARQVSEHPDRKWGNGMDDEEMHNLYPVIYNKQMSLGFREYTGKRPLIYSSGGYTGIQQFSATWAGDTGGGAKSLVSMINHGLSGHVNTSCDMDVFSKAGIHFGFLQPWSQLCSWAYWRHPWLLGDRLLPVFRHYAGLRYSLIPYIYSTAHQAHRSGMPILRGMPLIHDNAPDNAVLTHYYLGDWLLTSAFSRDFWLPEGTWIDFWNCARIQGPVSFCPEIPSEKGGPLFVKSGALIPRWPIQDYIGQKNLSTIYLDVYPGTAKSAFILYEDDGETFACEHGEIASTEFSFSGDENGFELVIGCREGTFCGMTEERTVIVRLRTHSRVSDLKLDGNPVGILTDDDAAGAAVKEIPKKRRVLSGKWV